MTEITTRRETFEVVLTVNVRNLTRDECAEQGFTLEEDEERGDDVYDPVSEPIERHSIAECMADAFHEEMIGEALAGSGLLCTIDKVSLARIQDAASGDASND